MSDAPILSASLFQFLADLRMNNNREWFTENRMRYDTDLKEPLLNFIAAMQPLLSHISPHILAVPKVQGGSLFRIYRDTRFSKDKTPYKTQAAVHFRHRGENDVHGPGFYLHMAPGDCFIGAGIWRPERSVLAGIRDAIVAKPERWVAVRKGLEKKGLTLVGDKLKRPPRGYDKEHPLIEDLKQKDFIVTKSIHEGDVCSADFPEIVTEHFRGANGFMKFVSGGAGVPW